MDIKSLTGVFFRQDTPVTRPDIHGAIQRPLSLPALQPGQILQATVLKTDNPEQLLLNLQGLVLKVPTPPPGLVFRPGDSLKLQFIQGGELPQFKLLTPPGPSGSGQPGMNGELQSVNHLLRSQLPQLQSMPPLLARIQWMAQPAPAQNASAPITNQTPNQNPIQNSATTTLTGKDIQSLAQQVYNRIPLAEQIRQPQALKQALMTSGVFWEHNLQQAAINHQTNLLQQDIRTHLLRLAAALRVAVDTSSAPSFSPAGKSGAVYKNEATPALISSHNPRAQPQITQTIQPNNTAVPPQGAISGRVMNEMLEQTEGVLARMLLHQYQHLKTEEQPTRLWSLELPLRSENNINLFDIRIQRDPYWSDPYAEQEKHSSANGKEPEYTWTIRIAFELESLGPVYANIRLHNKQISVQFHAEQNVTQVLFSNYMDMLGSRLRHAGLDVDELDCRLGKPEPIPEPASAPILDEQA